MLDLKYQSLVDQVETNWGTISKLELVNLTFGKSYYLYNQDGTFAMEFNSGRDLAKHFHFKANSFATHNRMINGYIVKNERKEKLSQSEILAALPKSCRARKVDQLDLNGNVIATFNSIVEAGNRLGILNRGIRKVLDPKSNYMTYKGFKWQYHKEEKC